MSDSSDREDGDAPPASGATGATGARTTAGSRLGALAAAGLPVALVDGGSGLGLGLALAYDAALIVGAAIEARSLAKNAPRVTRRMDARLVLGVPNTITIRVHNPSDRTLRVVVRDDLPEGWEADPPELVIELPPFARRDVSYAVRPPRRGKFELGDLHLRIEGTTRLGAAIVRAPAAAEARVYPNVLGPRRYELAARLGDLRSVGFRSIRLAGGGGEFEQLREYVRGDPYRDVDWKSTAKRHRPISRVYQQERSQLVVLAIDAGRTMATPLARDPRSAGADAEQAHAITKLDHVINAALLLAYVAIRKGDRVALVVFADVVRTYVPPRAGPAQYRRLLDALFSVQAEETYVDFRRLVEFVQLEVRRRSLVVLFSDLLDEAHAMPLAEHAAILRRKHLPVCVTMEDVTAETLAVRPVRRPSDVFERAAAADVLAERESVKAHLRKNGVGLVEAPAGDLAVATVNKYLEIKARRAL